MAQQIPKSALVKVIKSGRTLMSMVTKSGEEITTVRELNC